MRKIGVVIITLFALTLFGVSNAAAVTFIPSPSGDMWDLDHYKYYQWGINWTVPSGETISAAYLEIFNINDWTNETGDILWVNLLNTAPLGVVPSTDNQNSINAFSGPNTFLIDTYTDETPPYGAVLPGAYLKFNVPATHLYWLADGNFGWGVDPDCHYYNTGIQMTIETMPVPEPTTLYLLGLGLVGLGIWGRKKFRK